jgi:hypothetical protein
MKKYILNTSILTDYGVFDFSKISLDEAKAFVSDGIFESAVGHQATAEVMTDLLGIKIPNTRMPIKMASGDKALVFKLTERLPEGKILTKEELLGLKFELGILSMS